MRDREAGHLPVDPLRGGGSRFDPRLYGKRGYHAILP